MTQGGDACGRERQKRRNHDECHARGVVHGVRRAEAGLGTSTSFSPPYPVNDSARMALIMISPFLPFATAGVSPLCHANDRLAYAGSRLSGGDVGTLSQAAAEGNVLARCLVERDEEIVWRDSGR